MKVSMDNLNMFKVLLELH